MQKLSLKLEDLALQSFATTLAGGAAGGTVLGHLDDTSHDGCSGEYSGACATQIYTCAGCETYDEPCTGGGPDGQRRIIVYQTPA